MIAGKCAFALVTGYLVVLALADFKEEKVPGFYFRTRGSAANCALDIDIKRSFAIQDRVPGKIEGRDISGGQYICSKGNVEITRDSTPGRRENAVTKNFIKNTRVALQLHPYFGARVTSSIECVRRGDAAFNLSTTDQIWYFFEPKSDISVVSSFPRAFQGESELDDGTKYLAVGEDCLYIRQDWICFPGSATTRLENGETRRMDELRIGDRVEVGNGQFSEVFMWTHKMPTAPNNRYVRLETESGHALTLTHGHYLYANGKRVLAWNVNIGDELVLADGRRSRVVKKDSAVEQGFYNPQTIHGDIVVNGIVTSTYTSAIKPELAHSALSPLRALFRAARAMIPASGDKDL